MVHILPALVLLGLTSAEVWASSSNSSIIHLIRAAFFPLGPTVTGLVLVSSVQAVDTPHCVLLCMSAVVTCVVLVFDPLQGACGMYGYGEAEAGGEAGGAAEMGTGMKWYLNEGNGFLPRTALPRDCLSVLHQGATSSGTYPIQVEGATSTVLRCDLHTNSGGWTVFQARVNGSVSFDRPWSEYRAGFGDPRAEYWAGTELIHQLTKPPGVTSGNRLRVELLAWNGTMTYAEYDGFVVNGADDNYRLGAGLTYIPHSTAVDALTATHAGTPFSTQDADHDYFLSFFGGNCAQTYGGGWWFANCHEANLNGVYNATGSGHGLMWEDNFYSYKATTMMPCAIPIIEMATLCADFLPPPREVEINII